MKRYKVISPNFGGVDKFDEDWLFLVMGIKIEMTNIVMTRLKKLPGTDVKEIQDDGVVQDITSFYANLNEKQLEQIRALGFYCSEQHGAFNP